MRRVAIGVAIMVTVLSVATAAALQAGESGGTGDQAEDISDATADIQSTPSDGTPELQVHAGGPGEGEDAEVAGGRPFIGISILTLSEAEAGELGVTGGVVVTRVFPHGPASGLLEAGAIIVAFNGEAVTSVDQLLDLVSVLAPGDVVSLTLLGEESPTEITLGHRPDELRGHGPAPRGPHGYPVFGTHGLVESLLGRFVSSEHVFQSDDGLNTISVFAGTVTSVNTSTRTIVFLPKDGSGVIVLVVPQGEEGSATLISGGKRVELEDLHTETLTIVVTVRSEGSDTATPKLVVQLGDAAGVQELLGHLAQFLRLGLVDSLPLPELFQHLEDDEKLREHLERAWGAETGRTESKFAPSCVSCRD